MGFGSQQRTSESCVPSSATGTELAVMLRGARCSFCGGESFRLTLQAPNFDGRGTSCLGQCTNCGAVLTFPRLDESSLSSLYGADYYGTYDAKYNKFAELGSLISNWSRASLLHRFAANTVAFSARQPVALDVGCGRGILLRMLRRRGWACWGLERPDYPWSHGVDFEFLRSTLESAPFVSEQFDLVVLWHSLEHMTDPLSVLKKAFSLLRKGGVLAISCPNYDSFQRRLFAEHWYSLDLPRHRHHMGLGQILSVLSPRYSILRVGTRSVFQNPVSFIQSTLNVLVRRRPNALYADLRARGDQPHHRLMFLLELCLAVLVLPIALLEDNVSALVGKGASFVIVAQKSTRFWDGSFWDGISGEEAKEVD